MRVIKKSRRPLRSSYFKNKERVRERGISPIPKGGDSDLTELKVS